ncbi:hypothetical protein EDM80_10120 [bacterium]|nr:MAG: hypothetical protein EDM80_10120 [bacterium]
MKKMTGTHCGECFFTTETTLREEEIVSLYTRRRPIEVMFQETMQQPGLNDPRQWKGASVFRMTPRLFKLHGVIATFRHSGRG